MRTENGIEYAALEVLKHGILGNLHTENLNLFRFTDKEAVEI